MPRLSTKTRKYLRYTLSGFLVTGMILITGFLSFTGALVLNDSIYCAIAAFLGAAIEGELYAQSISSSLLKLFTDGYLEDAIYSQKLAELIDEPSKLSSCQFLRDYSNLLAYLHQLEESHDDTQHEELENTKRSLKWMRRHFKDFMKKDSLSPEIPSFAELDKLITLEDKKRLQTEISKKKWHTRLSWVLNLGAGLSCALVGLDVAKASILTLGAHFGFALSGAALSVSIFGLAIIGAVGYTFMIHNTLSDMIQNDTLQKWAASIPQFFSRREHESKLKYGLRIIGGSFAIGIVVSLGIFATIATAGTWWYAAKAGAKMIPLISSCASGIRSVAVSLMGISSLTFNVVNSLESAKELAKISIHHYWQKIRDVIKDHSAIENRFQLLNPARIIINIITIPFKVLAFIGHLISMALGSDKLKGVDPRVTTVINSASEGLQDAHFFMPSHEHEKHKHPENHKQKAETPSHQHNHHRDHKQEDEIHSHKHNHCHSHQGGHQHHHADLMGKFLKLALSPLYLLGAFWDYGFSKLNTSTEQQLTLKQAIKKSFFGFSINKQLKRPQLSQDWLKIEKEKRIQKAIDKRAEALLNEQGRENIEELKNVILNKVSEPSDLAQEVHEAAFKSAQLSDDKDVSFLEPDRGRSAPNSFYYLNSDGSINASLFFQNRPMGNTTKQVCDKLIKIANTGKQVTMSR